MSSVDELFTKRLPVSLKFTERDHRKSHVSVAVEVHTTPSPVHKKELVVRLTDESDLFFLYTLKLAEEDFQSLKTQQGLLVDFSAFPQKFIDLLELCIQEKDKENPKFILDLVANGSNNSCTANLNVIETNAFKHLTHLSLKFLPGTDTDIKKYLAHCLKCLKDQNTTLLGRLEQTEGDLGSQLRQAREVLANKSQELDSLRSQWNATTADQGVQHRQQLTGEREKALQTLTETQERNEKERREIEQTHSKQVQQLDTRLREVEAANKDLTDRRYKSESTIRELKAKLGTLEEEHHHARQELQTLRKDNAGLDCNYHEQDKAIQQLRTRVAVLEQEVKDKEEVKRKTSELLVSEQQQKKKLEEEVERKKRHLSKVEGSIKTISEELLKANDIIQKFQGDIKAYHTKLKLRDQVNIEQEKLLVEKNKEMEELRRELEQAKTASSNKQLEVTKLNETLQTTMQKLEESRQLLKTNENVINWLNKQVTETQLGRSVGAVGGPGPFEMNSSAATASGLGSRHLHNYSAGASRLSSSIRSEPPSHYNTQRYMPSQPPAPRGPHVHYQPGAPSAIPPGMNLKGLTIQGAKSSPIGVIPEEHSHSPQASPHHPSNQPKLRSSQSEPAIDQRFLQRTEEVPLREGPRSVTPTSTSLHFSSQPSNTALHPASQPSAPSTHQPSRLSKEAILNQRPIGYHGGGAGKPGGTQSTPLASAYFPSQGKVT